MASRPGEWLVVDGRMLRDVSHLTSTWPRATSDSAAFSTTRGKQVSNIKWEMLGSLCEHVHGIWDITQLTSCNELSTSAME